MDVLKIVIEHVSPSHRRYHVNTSFNCELERDIFYEQLRDMMQTTYPENISEAAQLIQQFLQKHSPECSLEIALNTLEHALHDHNDAAGIIDVTINLARADWSTIQKQVIRLIKKNLAWEDLVELEIV